MTRDETKDLVRSIISIYPNWKPENLTDTVNAWHWALKDYPAIVIKSALQIYVKTNNTGFAPSVSQLIAAMYKPVENEQITEGEAWYLVKQAIQGANYNAEENYAKLPPIIQKAVGGPAMLRQWGMTDSDEVNTVVMSNFQRTYRALAERERFEQKVPEQLSGLIKGLVEQTSGTKAITDRSIE